jgi:uncharacterized protein (DUF1778 family)
MTAPVTPVLDSVLARASKPTKVVTKVIAVRITAQTHDILEEQAKLAGVKSSDIVRAAVEQFCAEATEAK